jgi:hypothetical protein
MNFTLKKSLSGVSLWAWGLGTASHICSKMETAQLIENTMKHQTQKRADK